MNFYKHYIGDFQRDTGHLSLVETGAYRAMLDHHYATEAPLPKKVRELHRLVGANTKSERAAVARILTEFFHETETGWVNARTLKEIEKADHQRTVNRAVGRLGGRPRKTESVSESVSESEPNNNPNQTPDTRQVLTQPTKELYGPQYVVDTYACDPDFPEVAHA